jgi:hypothetical protein
MLADALGRIADQSLKHPLPNPGFGPSRKPRVDALPLAVSLGKIVPMRSRAQNPKDAVDPAPVHAHRRSGP